MHTLCSAILSQIPIQAHFHSPVEEIRPDGIVSLNRFYPADLILSALPADVIAPLLLEPCPTRFEHFHVVNLGYLGRLPLNGYGYLVPTRENELLLGMIWDTSIFPHPTQTKLTAMVRGPEPLSTAISALQRHLRIVRLPDAHLTTPVAVPQYDLGHASRISSLLARTRSSHPRLRLLGNYLCGASVNACIRSAMIVSVY